MNHRELCEIGARFLKRSESANGHGCHFAIVEPACYGENPDVFGVRHGSSGYDIGTVLLEAKTSRSDFLVDKKKPHRISPEKGVGKWRYFICPTDLIKPEELPEKWGLIYVSRKGICKIISGAMGIKKEKHQSDWGQREVRYWRNGKDLEQSFIQHAFNERNIQNEFNLITMALARIDDPEQILYMKRNYTRMEQKNHELTYELNRIKRDEKLREFNNQILKIEVTGG